MVHWDFGEAVGDFEHHAQTYLLTSSFQFRAENKAGSYYVRSGQLGTVLSQVLVRISCLNHGDQAEEAYSNCGLIRV